MRITAFAGGVGGAKLANGFAQIMDPDMLSIVVNTGDDFLYSGLHICPDIDTITYTLAGINDPVNGWGIIQDTKNVLTSLEQIGHPIWFKLGDRDIATHIERSRLLESGISLTATTAILADQFGVRHTILPMTDDAVITMVDTLEFGVIGFQDYFVRHRFEPTVKSINFEGITKSSMTEGVAQAIQSSDVIVFCPSNPFVSIEPILSVPGIRDLVKHKPVIAVSPLIGGKTVKGPAAKLMMEMNMQPNALNIAKYYGKLLSGFVIDHIDRAESESIRQCGIIPFETDILMTNLEDQVRLARKVSEFSNSLL